MRVRSKLWLLSLEDRCTPATITVTSLADSGAGSLRAAITLAEKDPTPDTIVFDPSIQGGTIDLNTFDPGLGSNQFGPSAFYVTTPITIQGSGETISRNPAASPFRLFAVLSNNGSGQLTLSGVELTGGLAHGGDGFAGGGGAGGFGGAIYNTGRLTLRGVTLSGNNAQGGSGGAAPDSLTVGGGGGVGQSAPTDSSGSGGGPNPGTGFGGFGGIGGGGGAGSESTAGNGGFGGGGGGANAGGIAGVGGFGGGGGAADFAGSEATGGYGAGGGAFGVGGGGGAGMGGGVFNNAGTVTIESSTFSGNGAVAGTGGTNTAMALGGGLFNLNGTVTIRSSTFTENVGTIGGRQIYALAVGQFSAPAVFANTDITNSILGQSDVVFTDFAADVINGGITNSTGSGNLIRTSTNYSGSTAKIEDPLLGPLTNNGGLTRTRLPLTGSPAIDALPASAAGTLTADQRGLTRVVNGRLDIGSVEVQPPPPPPPPVVITYLVGIGGDVQVRNADGSLAKLINAFDPAKVKSTNVAYADVNGDGVRDIIAGAGTGGSGVKVYDGVTDALLFDFDAFPGFNGGVSVAAGDLNLDGIAELVIGAGAGGSPHVKVFDLSAGSLNLVRSFYAFSAGFSGGVNVAATTGVLVAAAGPGGGPQVKVYLGLSDVLTASFYAFAPDFHGGVVAAIGDINGDGVPDIVAGAGQFGGPEITVFDGATASKVKDFLAYDPGFRGGVSVAIQDVDGDGLNDFIFWAGPGGGPHVIVRDARTLDLFSSYYATADTFRDGVRTA